jgi:UDP-2-acetamido-3-amino-2,3-dideoxy-glucuronate N-acetyltransferase
MTGQPGLAQPRIDPTAAVSPKATIGPGSQIWQHVQIREGASVGANCILSKGVYLDPGVVIGNNVKVQNYVSIFSGVTLEDGVFCGPHAVFTNDKLPRAINPDGTLKSGADWEITPTMVKYGAAIGANATIVCGITIGRWAMIGAGAVVTRDVPDHGLVSGNPARLTGFVCACGQPLTAAGHQADHVVARCNSCGLTAEIQSDLWETVEQ